MRYGLGIAAAIIAGIAFNIGVLIQKDAVSRAPKGGALMKHLLKSRVWLGGLALQFAIGTPLYILSVGLIGPAIVPGLMAIGMVVLALGAIVIQKERVNPRELAGVAFVVLAVAAFGLTGLSIDVLAGSMKDPGLLLRSGLFTAVLLAIVLGCARAARGVEARAEDAVEAPDPAGDAPALPHASPASSREIPAEGASALHAVRAGIWYSLGNLGLGFLIAGLSRFNRGIIDPAEIAVFLAAVALTVLGNVYGIAGTQHALSRGRAAVAIPLQTSITQILPVGIFFFVYKPYAPALHSLIFLASGVVLLVSGAVLLTSKLAGKHDPSST